MDRSELIETILDGAAQLQSRPVPPDPTDQRGIAAGIADAIMNRFILIHQGATDEEIMNNTKYDRSGAEKMKAMQYEAEMKANCATQAQYGAAGLAQQASPSLRSRVQQQMDDANTAARKAQALGELADLLDKYPEVGRILDLMEMVR